MRFSWQVSKERGRIPDRRFLETESPEARQVPHLFPQQQEGQGRKEEVQEGIAEEDFQRGSRKERINKLQEKHQDPEEDFKLKGIHGLQQRQDQRKGGVCCRGAPKGQT